MATHTIVACLSRMKRVREVGRDEEREREKYKPESFCDSVSEVTFHNFCHVLFVRREDIGPAYTEKKVTHGCGYQEARIIEIHFRGCLPQVNDGISNTNRHFKLCHQ